MKTRIRVVEGGRPEILKLANETLSIPDPAPRHWIKPWIRIHRDTFDDAGVCIKTELAVFRVVDGQMELEWREVTSPKQLLTDIAPITEYLVYEKSQC